MNIKDLKEKIKDLPDNMNVMIEQTNDEFQISMANEASVIETTFTADALRAEEDCLVIRD